MRASVLAEYGGPDVLHLSDVRDPVVPSGWTVVEVRAAGLNWHDVLVRQGVYGSPLPHVLGADAAGVDRVTGEDVIVVPSMNWGQRATAPGPSWEILGDRHPGTYAELVAVPSSCVIPKPAGLDWAQAGTFALTGLTTYRALFTRGRLSRGETLVVIGAGGGVATTAISCAAAVGARIFVTSSTRGKLDRAIGLGALGGVLYTEPEWPAALRDLCGGADVVLDPVGQWADAIRLLRPGGRLVVLGASRAEVASLRMRPFYFGQYDLLGTTMGSPDDLAGMLGLFETGRVTPPIVDRTFPLDRAADAHRHLESGAGFGKTVLLL